jgi:hypothetical protein
MKTPHIHAEVMIAWLNDQSIKLEYRHRTWSHWQPQDEEVTPLTHPLYEWRIKPEPKPNFIRYGFLSSVFLGREVAENKDNIKLTFDGETGKLKSAEVL